MLDIPSEIAEKKKKTEADSKEALEVSYYFVKLEEKGARTSRVGEKYLVLIPGWNAIQKDDFTEFYSNHVEYFANGRLKFHGSIVKKGVYEPIAIESMSTDDWKVFLSGVYSLTTLDVLDKLCYNSSAGLLVTQRRIHLDEELNKLKAQNESKE